MSTQLISAKLMRTHLIGSHLITKKLITAQPISNRVISTQVITTKVTGTPRENLWCFFSGSLTDPRRILQGFALFSWGKAIILKKACSHYISRFWQDSKQDVIKILTSFPLDLRSGISSGNGKSWKKLVATKCQGFRQDSKQDLRQILSGFLYFLSEKEILITRFSRESYQISSHYLYRILLCFLKGSLQAYLNITEEMNT